MRHWFLAPPMLFYCPRFVLNDRFSQAGEAFNEQLHPSIPCQPAGQPINVLHAPHKRPLRRQIPVTPTSPNPVDMPLCGR